MILPVGTLLAFLLVLARVAGLFTFVPLPGGPNTPPTARIVLALAFTFALFPAWPTLANEVPAAGQLVCWVAAELAFGLAVGVTVSMLSEAFTVAAQAINLQAGFSFASTIDPATQADTGILPLIVQTTTGLLFFAFGFDRLLIRILSRSLEAYRPGTYVLSVRSGLEIAQLGQHMLVLSLRIALPIIALLMIVDLALALVGRLNAQLQLLSLAFPVKILAAFFFLGLLYPLLPSLYEAGAEYTLKVLARVLQLS